MEKLIEPGTRIVQIVEVERENPKENEEGTYVAEVVLTYLRDVLTYRQLTDDILVQYTGWVCKDVESGEIGIFDPNLGTFYFDGESPLQREKFKHEFGLDNK